MTADIGMPMPRQQRNRMKSLAVQRADWSICRSRLTFGNHPFADQCERKVVPAMRILDGGRRFQTGAWPLFGIAGALLQQKPSRRTPQPVYFAWVDALDKRGNCNTLGLMRKFILASVCMALAGAVRQMRTSL